MRLVLDTNVLIAAFISHGVCNELFEHCILNHEIILSDFILAEVKEKLTCKFKFTVEEANGVIGLLKSRCAVVKISGLLSPICRDPDDDNIIATAVSGNCRCIVSGDADLLDLEQVEDILLVSPSRFWKVENI